MRYLLFGGNETKGGAHDLLGSGNNAIEVMQTCSLDHEGEGSYVTWWHLFDTELMEIVVGSEELT